MTILDQGLVIERKIELLDKLGSGGQAPIWRVRELGETRRILAAKLLETLYDEKKDEIFQQMRQEMHNLCLIRGTNVVEIYYPIGDIIEAADRKRTIIIGYAMPFYKEGDFSTPEILREVRSDQATLASVLEGLISGVRTIHVANVVHFDLKPANVLVFREAKKIVPKLSDFGAAYSINEQISALGTPPYMAPERFERPIGSGQEGKRSDIYSLGLLLYEVLTSRYAYHALTETHADKTDRRFYGHLHKEREPDWDLIPRSLPRFRELLSLMLRKDPHRRPDIELVADEFENIKGEFTKHSSSSTKTRRSSISENTYLWNPRLHELLGYQKYFYLLRANRFSAALDEIQRVAREETNTNSTTLIVFGSNDIIVSAWEKPTNRTVHNILANLGKEFDPKLQNFPVKKYIVSGQERIKPIDMSDVENWMNSFIHTASDDEREKLLSDKRFVLRKIEPKPNEIMMFVVLNWTRDLEPGVEGSYSRVVIDFLKNAEFRDYALAISENRRTFLVQIKVADYKKCGHVVSSIHNLLSSEEHFIPGYQSFSSDTYLDTLDYRRTFSEDGEFIQIISREMRISPS